jgi:hypothetical protein
LLVDELALEGIVLSHLDIGGGLGIRYRDETPPAPQELVTAVREKLGNRKLRLILEPGRSICGNAGVLLTRVDNIKANGEHNFAIVDAAMNDIIRPALYQAWMDVVPVIRDDAIEKQTYDIVGPICETGDFLAVEVRERGQGSLNRRPQLLHGRSRRLRERHFRRPALSVPGVIAREVARDGEHPRSKPRRIPIGHVRAGDPQEDLLRQVASRLGLPDHPAQIPKHAVMVGGEQLLGSSHAHGSSS